MGCCTTSSDPTETMTHQTCPACGGRARRVPPSTLDALLIAGTERRNETYRFCPSVGCDVAWFSEETAHRLPPSAARVDIGQKSTAPDRTLCYCFGFTAADVAADATSPEDTTIAAVITARCREGLDHCHETNPQGACCLGNVRAAMRSLQE